MIDEKLLNVLACPECKGDVKGIGMFLVCENCKLAFPMLDDVPDMVIEDSWKLEEAKKHKFKHDLQL
jgi:uncharacterized protein YbaR (Trm112 family)